MNAPYIYFLPKRLLKDMKAVIDLLSEKYSGVTRPNNAPGKTGLIYETRTPIAEGDMEALDVLPWI